MSSLLLSLFLVVASSALGDLVGFTGSYTDNWFVSSGETQYHPAVDHSYGFVSGNDTANNHNYVCPGIRESGYFYLHCGFDFSRFCAYGEYPNCTDHDGYAARAFVQNRAGPGTTITFHVLW